MPWHLWHGHFHYFAEGNSPSLSVLGLMYDTTCDLFFFQCPFSPPRPPFALFQPTPATSPKNDPCFPAFVLAQPNPTNQGFARTSGSPHRRPPACRLRFTCLSCSSCEEIMWMPSQNWTVWKFDGFRVVLILVRESQSSKKSRIAFMNLLFCLGLVKCV